MTGLTLVGFCQEIDLDVPHPLCPNLCVDQWSILGEGLAKLCGQVESSEFLPGPLRLLIAAGGFGEIESMLDWL